MKFKRIAAGLSAASMAAVMTATSIPAFAEEVQMLEMQAEMQAYVASIEDEQLQQVAVYLSDEGFSLDETKEILERCENSQEQMQETIAAQSSGTTYFHSTSVLVSDRHPCFIFMRGPYVGENFLRVNMTFPTGAIVSNFAASATLSSTGVANDPPEGSEEYYSLIYDTNSLGWGESVPIATCNIQKGTAVVTNEKDLVAAITAECYIASNANMNSVSFAAITYCSGDIDHDGVITDNDAAYLSYYLAGTASFGGSYYDVTSAEAKYIREQAADVDHDGDIDRDDLVRLNRYLAGQITIL